MADTVTRATPTTRQYWLIALGLGIITAVEVAVGWFMHLRFDMILYRRFFLFGLIGAPLLFVVVLLTFTGYAP